MTPADVQKKGLSEDAFLRIKEDIVWCRLLPGAEVSEAKLAAMYGFGKAPIRHALSRLAQEAYIVSQPRRGHVIAPVTLKAVRELFEWRLIVETAAVDMACGKVDRDRLLALDARCVTGYSPGDVASEKAFIEANNAFHLEIAGCAGNSRVEKALRQILEEMTRLLHLGYVLRERPKELSAEHKTLINALSDGDRDTARSVTIAHINSIKGLVIEGITEFSSLNEMNIAPLGTAGPHRRASG